MIQVTNLTFSYTKKPFIKDMNFQVKKGEIFGFLGPSGSGKSTLQKILTGQIRNYLGSVTLADTECRDTNRAFYENIGVDFEFSTTYDKLTARQNLSFFASLYNKPLRSMEELLKTIGLHDDADKKLSDYSKGMRTRLNFIKALIHDPDILFLDEPTSGLDPTNSRVMKDMILTERTKGKTILLTTHNMADASELCDKVAFIVNGTIVALDTPHNLIMKKGAAKVKYTYLDGIEKKSECLLSKIADDHLLHSLILQNQITSIHSSEPNLNDIFIEVTGRKLI